MLRRILNWFDGKPAARPKAATQVRRRSSAHAAVKSADKHYGPEFSDDGDDLASHVESLGPGKNVLIRNRYVREETGTHETLKILDDSMVESGEEDGFDPYNSGEFDRSRNWDKRFRN